MDWGSLQQELAAVISDAKDVLEAQKFTAGAGHGSTEPQGLITGATGTVAAGTAAFAVANVYALQQSLAPRFSANARWLSSLTHANAAWKMVAFGDTMNARIWSDDPHAAPRKAVERSFGHVHNPDGRPARVRIRRYRRRLSRD